LGANFSVKSEIFKNTGYLIQILEEFQENCIVMKKLNFYRDCKLPGKVLYYPSSIIYHCVSADKLSKRYLRKWRFDDGELRGILMKDKKYFNLFNIQSLTNKKMLRDIIASVLRIGCFSKNRFDHELRICFILGFLSGRMKGIGQKS
jgi:hypothetical protein